MAPNVTTEAQKIRRSKMAWTLSIVAFVAVGLPVGCWKARPVVIDYKVRPVIRAVENFRRKSGHLPQSLDGLPSLEGVRLKHPAEGAIIWSINYEVDERNTNSYTVSYNHAHYDVSYVNGKRQEISYNFFR